MGNNRNWLARQQALKNAEMERVRQFAFQWCADAAILAANEVFQRKGEKIVEFFNAFVRYSTEIAEMTMADAKYDKSIDYTKGKVDERLKDILGESFDPWEKRYRF